MELHNTVPQEADAEEDGFAEALEQACKLYITSRECHFDLYSALLQEPGVAERTDGEQDAPVEPPSDREDPISSSEDEPSGIDLHPHFAACRDT